MRLLPRDAGGDDECDGGRGGDGEAAVCRGFLTGVVVGGGELRRCYPCCPAAWKKIAEMHQEVQGSDQIGRASCRERVLRLV